MADHGGRQRGGSVPLAELVEETREPVQPSAKFYGPVLQRPESCLHMCGTVAGTFVQLFGNYAEELFWIFFGTPWELWAGDPV